MPGAKSSIHPADSVPRRRAVQNVQTPRASLAAGSVNALPGRMRRDVIRKDTGFRSNLKE